MKGRGFWKYRKIEIESPHQEFSAIAKGSNGMSKITEAKEESGTLVPSFIGNVLKTLFFVLEDVQKI